MLRFLVLALLWIGVAGFGFCSLFGLVRSAASISANRQGSIVDLLVMTLLGAAIAAACAFGLRHLLGKKNPSHSPIAPPRDDA
jgi:hypothetical protein